MKLIVEFDGNFLGYVSNERKVPELAVEKGISPEDVDKLHIVYAQPVNIVIKTTAKKAVIEALNKKALKEAPKKRGRKPKLEKEIESAE